MSDSLISQYGLTICTDSFTIAENVTLINILKIKYFIIKFLNNAPVKLIGKKKLQYLL